MKKALFIIGTAMILLPALTSVSIGKDKTELDVSGSTFKVVNNTGEKVKLEHSGGSVSLNNGSSTSLSCTREGNEIYIDGEHLHTVSSADCGKTYKIKDWM
ncbi:MAG: hypothetical protein MI810_08100 [Flavobacteriales bacterium]|nr:hypothetical protein [Flavobacteriales bacterium]